MSKTEDKEKKWKCVDCGGYFSESKESEKIRNHVEEMFNKKVYAILCEDCNFKRHQ